MRLVSIITALFIMFPHHDAQANDKLTMVYRTTAKEPFIMAAPDHDGIWKRVYEHAAHKIGLELDVVRLPKKRAYLLLKNGEVDFYPAASFKPERANFGFYINSQYEEEGIVIIHNAADKINSVEDIVGFDLLVNLGNTSRFYKDAGIDIEENNIEKSAELDIERAIEIVQKRNKTIYAYTDVSINKFLEGRLIPGIKLFDVTFKKPISYLLLSKKSAFYKEKPSPDFNPQKPASIENLPYMLDESSIAYQFQEALHEMRENGDFDKLVAQQPPQLSKSDY